MPGEAETWNPEREISKPATGLVTLFGKNSTGSGQGQDVLVKILSCLSSSLTRTCSQGDQTICPFPS